MTAPDNHKIFAKDISNNVLLITLSHYNDTRNQGQMADTIRIARIILKIFVTYLSHLTQNTLVLSKFDESCRVRPGDINRFYFIY